MKQALLILYGFKLALEAAESEENINLVPGVFRNYITMMKIFKISFGGKFTNVIHDNHFWKFIQLSPITTVRVVLANLTIFSDDLLISWLPEERQKIWISGFSLNWEKMRKWFVFRCARFQLLATITMHFLNLSLPVMKNVPFKRNYKCKEWLTWQNYLFYFSCPNLTFRVVQLNAKYIKWHPTLHLG